MSDDATKFYAPDAAFIEALAKAAVGSLPDDFRAAAGLMALHVQDFVSGEHLEAMGLEDPYELTSLCQSTPEILWIYRRPILDEWAERGDICLADLVSQTVYQELADHFGWSDAEIAAHPGLRSAFAQRIDA